MTPPEYLFRKSLGCPVDAPWDQTLLDYWQGSFRMLWQITDKGDRQAWELAERHYTRQTPGSRLFTRNGQNLVFVTECGKAAWVTFRPTPGKATRADKLDAWECALFRNESKWLSSYLILEAQALTIALWGPTPKDGLITFVKPGAIRSINPGACYKKAGWKRVGESKDGKPLLKAPEMVQLDWRMWVFKEGRGGKLRDSLLGPRC